MAKLLHLEQNSILQGQQAPDLLVDETLSDIFRNTVAQYDECPAIVFEESTLTYHQLDALTERLAHTLFRYGIGRGARVGIWMERSLDLHAAIIAVVKAGGAWVPLDGAIPLDRAVAICSDACVVAILTDKEDIKAFDGHFEARVLSYKTMEAELTQTMFSALTGPEPDGAAYVIYTSGSTGKPKGVEITHRNICHFIRSENAILGLRHTDLVWQGFSPSFDMWLEEVAISWLVGACLQLGSRTAMQELDRLPARITEAGVTVLHCVPSMLAMLEEDMPTLRLINLGGEACQEALVSRWWRKNRRMFNTYGPTETTVSATIAELHPGEPITIGHPLPNYRVYIVDEHLNPVPAGVTGELLIGGPGVATGYVGQAELTARKFLPDTFVQPDEVFGTPGEENPTALSVRMAKNRIYKTGDAASMDTQGRILFHGRLDDQVKLRGYRIELGEIETILAARPDVRTVAVTLRKDAMGLDQLAAFIVPGPEHADATEIREALGDRLPGYMVPSIIQFVETMPRLSSGKIDRKKLPEITDLLSPSESDVGQNTRFSGTSAEQKVAVVCSKLFDGRRVRPEDDFFQDLGGHSLLVAALVSELRKDPRYRSVSIRDIYTERTVTRIAARLEVLESDYQARVSDESANPPPRKSRSVSNARYWLCGFAQLLVLPLLYAAVAYEFGGAYLAYVSIEKAHLGVWIACGTALLVLMAAIPGLMIASIAAKWLLLGRVREGEHPLWGAYYWRWWLATTIMEFSPAGLLNGTPFQAVYLRLLGARIGSGAYLGSINMDAPDLVEIGHDVSFGSHVSLRNAHIEDGMLKLRRIRVDDHAYVGSGSLLTGGSRIEAWGELGNLSLLPLDQTLPAGQIWQGAPAKFVRDVREKHVAQNPSQFYRGCFGVAQVALLLGMLLFTLAPLFPVLWSIGLIRQHFPGELLPLALLLPLLSALSIVLFAMQVVALRWLVLGRVSPGTYSIWRFFYLRKWLVDQMLELSLSVLHPVYASLYLPPWLRLLGARVGRRAEVSTVSSITPDLLELGEESFIADLVILGDSHIRHGELVLKRTVIGRRSFIGNCSVIPDGVHLPSDVLVGCLSTAEPEQLNVVASGSTWFGSPALMVPKREELSGFPEALTYRPGKRRFLARLAVEGIRIILPSTFMLATGVVVVTQLDRMLATSGYGVAGQAMPGWIMALLCLPVLYLGCVVFPAYLLTVLLKWVLIGRYKATAAPMWTLFVWLSEAVTVIYETLAVPLLLGFLRGTPFIAVALRLLGVQVGRRTFIDTTDMTEFDCVRIGDDAVLDENSGPQTHLFEDRIMKIGPVTIGDRAVLGSHAIALYGSTIEPDTRLSALSMVMKGETLPAGTAWVGSPARPQ